MEERPCSGINTKKVVELVKMQRQGREEENHSSIRAAVNFLGTRRKLELGDQWPIGKKTHP